MTRMTGHDAEVFRFADLTVDVATRRVFRGDAEIPLPGLSFDLLIGLLRNAPRVLSADELMTLVWRGRVVNQETVAKRVELLRDALGDDVDTPRYIAVVRGRGYRLLPEVQAAGSRQAGPADNTTGTAVEPAPASPRRWGRIAFPILAVVGVALALWLSLHRDSTDAPVAPPPPSNAEVASVAVLPFLNLSEDPANAWFADGMSEELLGTLARLPGLRVASRTSSFLYREKSVPLGDIARALNVDHVVEGSVRKVGDRVRITAQLIDARTDSHLWTQNYDRNLEDVFAIQQEIADHIADALKIRLVRRDEDTRPPTENVEAYQLYLQGVQVWNVRGERNIRHAIQLLTNAVELDPDFARAHAALGIALTSGPFWFDKPEPDLLERAVKAAERAQALDPTLPHPHCVFGVAAVIARDWGGAVAHFRRALQLSPNDSLAQYWMAELYSVAGRNADSLQLVLTSLERDPMSVAILHDAAELYMRQGRFDLACPFVDRGLRIGTNVHMFLQAVQCAEQTGDEQAVRDAVSAAERAFGFERPVFRLVREARADPAKKAAAMDAITREDKRGRWTPVTAHRELGNHDMVFDTIEWTWRQGNYGTMRVLWDADARELRAHPRFRRFVEDVGLVGFWRKSGWPEVCQPDGDSFTCQ